MLTFPRISARHWEREAIVSDNVRPSDVPTVIGGEVIVSEVRTAREAIFARARYDLQELGDSCRLVRPSSAARA